MTRRISLLIVAVTCVLAIFAGRAAATNDQTTPRLFGGRAGAATVHVAPRFFGGRAGAATAHIAPRIFGPRRANRPPAIHLTPTGGRVDAVLRRRLQGLIWIPVALNTPTRCGSSTMSADMPSVSSTGAAWTYWWPEIDANTNLYLGTSTGTLYSGGPVYAQNQTTNQEYYQDSKGVWHGPFASLSANVSPPLGGNVSYGTHDWFEFVYPNGSTSGWIDNGYRTLGYTGTHASNGVVNAVDDYGLPTWVSGFGCIY